MNEAWSHIPGFDSYSVSNYGAIRGRSDKILATYRNQSGLVYVTLYRKGGPHNRAIAPLVAGAFLDPPPEAWDTPIHLNGNRVDLFAGNLMWRPRWFAVEYHQQIGRYADPIDYIRDVATGEQASLRVMCMRYGLLPLKVYTQATNYTDHGNRSTTVWPTGQMFELI